MAALQPETIGAVHTRRPFQYRLRLTQCLFAFPPMPIYLRLPTNLSPNLRQYVPAATSSTFSPKASRQDGPWSNWVLVFER